MPVQAFSPWPVGALSRKVESGEIVIVTVQCPDARCTGVSHVTVWSQESLTALNMR